MRSRPNRKRNLWLPAILGLITANLIVFVLVLGTEEKKFVVRFYDVGQGDGALIQTPDGYNILVDGGPNNKISGYLNKDLSINDRQIDLMILTHPQSDHMYGLIEVVKKFKVKKILTSNVSHTTTDYKLWLDTVENQGLKVEFVQAGNNITLTDTVRLKFNWPKTAEEQKVTDLNQASLVFTLSYGDLDILMTGDADSQVQPYVGDFSTIEVLKVPHHGSKSSLKDDFLREIKPKVSVISVGAKNRYGHPRAELLDQLHRVGTEILRTDQNGTVQIVSDGERWYTQAEK